MLNVTLIRISSARNTISCLLLQLKIPFYRRISALERSEINLMFLTNHFLLLKCMIVFSIRLNSFRKPKKRALKILKFTPLFSQKHSLIALKYSLEGNLVYFFNIQPKEKKTFLSLMNIKINLLIKLRLKDHV